MSHSYKTAEQFFCGALENDPLHCASMLLAAAGLEAVADQLITQDRCDVLVSTPVIRKHQTLLAIGPP